MICSGLFEINTTSVIFILVSNFQYHRVDIKVLFYGGLICIRFAIIFQSLNTNILLMKNTKIARQLFANATVELQNVLEKHTTTNQILSMTPRNVSQNKCVDFVK